MRRLHVIVLAAAVVASTAAVVPARAVTCTYNGVVFNWCGDHWSSAKLPVTFRVDTSSAPLALRAQFASVVRAAADAWNQAWPLKGSDCAVICLTEGPATFGPADGKNGVSFAPTNGACGHGTGVLATTCVRTSGSDGFGKLIVETDIALTASPPGGRAWKIASGADLVMGELYALADLCSSWYDLQSALTHEFGHVLGLEHIGNEMRPYPADLTETPYALQTMYWHQASCSTNMRTLDVGDVAGLQVIALASAASR